MQEDTHHAILAMFSRGRITFVDDSRTVQVVQVQMNALDLPAYRYRVPEFGFASNPPINSDAIIAHIAGDRSSGVVLGTNHQQSRPTGLSSGESMLYSQDGKQVYLTSSGGIVVEAKGQDVTVNNATTVTINAATKIRMVTALLECTGDIVDNCDTTGRSMAADRVIYDSHEHNVRNVQGGSSTVTSDSPNQPE